MKILCKVANVAASLTLCACSMVVAALLVVGAVGVGLGVGLLIVCDWVEENYRES